MASLLELYRLQNTLTGEQIKSLYEGEFDTNAYTDAEKIKLASTLVVVPVPVTSTSPGQVGNIAVDTDYIYVCVASNTWKRNVLTDW
jgi:hypothetical protein